MRRKATTAGLVTNDALYGMHDRGAMAKDLILTLIAALGEGVTEVHVHPGARKPGEDLAALTDPDIRAALDAAGIRPVGYGDLSCDRKTV